MGFLIYRSCEYSAGTAVISLQEAEEGSMAFLALLKSHVFVIYVWRYKSQKEKWQGQGKPPQHLHSNLERQVVEKQDKDKCPSAPGLGSADIFHGI